MTTNLVAIGSERVPSSQETPQQKNEAQQSADFKQSLQAALANPASRLETTPLTAVQKAPSATQTIESPPAGSQASRPAGNQASQRLFNSVYTPGLRPVATIRSGAARLQPVSRAPLTPISGLFQPLQPSASTAFDRLRQRNDAIKSRLVGPSETAFDALWTRTPGIRNGSVTAPGGVQSARPSGTVTSGPMALADYPRPPQDNGRGMHWIPTTRSDKDTVDRFVREMVDMKMKWAVILNADTNIGDNDYLVQQLVANGIMPVMRVYTPDGRPIAGDLGALVRHYKPMGVHYYQLYNEPNLNSENEGRPPDVNRYVDLWTSAAKAVIEAGGLPGFASLAPGGNFDDIEFLKRSLDRVKELGETALFDRAWIGLHNYTLNHPLDYTKDSNGFLKFRFYDEIVRQKLGRSLPIIGTEGGTHVGVDCDKTMPAITEEKQVKMVVDAYDYMRNAEPYYFAYSYWIIANQAGGGADQGFEWQALFGNGKTSPVVAALKNMDQGARALPSGGVATRGTQAGAAIGKGQAPSGSFGQAMVDEAMKYLGKKYVWGGHSPSGFDCTGLTWYVMKQLGREFPQHDLEGQMRSGQAVAKADLQPGDLVFFKNTYRTGLSHVGIYVGNSRFVHAADERRGVIVSGLDEAYWGARYLGATRVAM